MNYSVGYPLSGNTDIFVTLVLCYKARIDEVFFSWPDIPNGRISEPSEYYLAKLKEHLSVFKHNNIKLNLLLNGNCYGENAVSIELRDKVYCILDEIKDVDVVTTTSPFLARQIKNYNTNIEVRASVNMWLGTIHSMQYLGDDFDSFYIQREYNRDIKYVEKISSWCHQNGKKLYMLANSGCLSYCSGHTFHDNLMSHQSKISMQKNVPDFEIFTCRKHLKNKLNQKAVLQGNWILPQDIKRYEGIIDGVKLATRTHLHPSIILSSYIRGYFDGNVLDLLEPGYGDLFAPNIIDAKKLPTDFFEKTSTCGKECEQCDYCQKALIKSLVTIDQL